MKLMMKLDKFKNLKHGYLLVAVLALFLTFFSNGCINAIDSGANSDYDAQDITGIPETLESRGMTVPEVFEITPKNGYYGPECPVTVTFNEKMDRASVESNFYIYNSKDYPCKGKFIWSSILNTDRECFEFIPQKQLITDSYKVMLMKGAKSYGGYEFKNTFNSLFTFKPIPEPSN